MPTATTIVIAREDFSIPGGDEPDAAARAKPGALETRFFNLVQEARPDVIVLDLSRANGAGTGMILEIRRRSNVPILVVCDENSADARDYRVAGAADCIGHPLDVVRLNQALQHIVRINRPAQRGSTPQAGHPGEPARPAETVGFAGLSFRPLHNLLVGAGNARAHLTSAEARLLGHFLANPWQTHSRTDLAAALYGRHRPASDRAIDVVVNRLRAKLRAAGDATNHLIRTEFRRGYRFVAQPASDP